VLAGWELFKTELHIHHTAEDQDLWPRMRTHLADRPDQLALLQAMQDEHGRIDPLACHRPGVSNADHNPRPATAGRPNTDARPRPNGTKHNRKPYTGPRQMARP
jgi:Hemerythrin HHE cation binding domain